MAPMEASRSIVFDIWCSDMCLASQAPLAYYGCISQCNNRSMVPKDRMLQRLGTYDLLGCPKDSPAGEAAMLPGLYRSLPPGVTI